MHGTIDRPGRKDRVDPRWTEAEDDILRDLWPDINAVRERLPHRTVYALRSRAAALRITNNRAEKPLTAREEKKIRELIEHFSSIDVVAALIGRKPRTVHNFISRRGWSLKKPKPRATGYRLYDEVRRRAHDMNLSYVDLDRSLGYRRKMFAATSSAPKVSIGMIQKAVEALGGRLVIEWESLEGEEVSK